MASKACAKCGELSPAFLRPSVWWKERHVGPSADPPRGSLCVLCGGGAVGLLQPLLHYGHPCSHRPPCETTCFVLPLPAACDLGELCVFSVPSW